MPLNDLLADGQAYTGTLVIFAGVQALKDDKDALEILGVDANAIVTHGKFPFLFPILHGNVHPRRFIRLVELKGIADQILEQLHQLGFIRHHQRHVIVGDHRMGFFDGQAQIGTRLAQGSMGIHGLQGLAACANPRIRQAGH